MELHLKRLWWLQYHFCMTLPTAISVDFEGQPRRAYFENCPCIYHFLFGFALQYFWQVYVSGNCPCVLRSLFPLPIVKRSFDLRPSSFCLYFHLVSVLSFAYTRSCLPFACCSSRSSHCSSHHFSLVLSVVFLSILFSQDSVFALCILVEGALLLLPDYDPYLCPHPVWYENLSSVVIRPDNSKHRYRWSG